MPAAGDGSDARPDGAGTLYVERRIANYPDALEMDVAVDVALHFRERFAGDVVALELLVAEAAEREMLVQAVVAELQAGAVADVAGEKTDGHIAAALQRSQQRRDAGEDLAVVPVQAIGQVAQVGRDKTAPVIRR